MAIVEPVINEVAFFRMMLRIADVIEEDIDSVVDWKGELGVVAEFADGHVSKRAMNSLKGKLLNMLKEAQREAILTSFKEPRKLKLKEKKNG